MDREQVVIRIEQLLQEKHITYNELKESANLSTTIYQWRKTGKRDATRMPSLKSIEKICDYFGVTLSYFFAGTDKERLSIKQKELMSQIKLLDEEELALTTALIKMLNQKKALKENRN